MESIQIIWYIIILPILVAVSIYLATKPKKKKQQLISISNSNESHFEKIIQGKFTIEKQQKIDIEFSDRFKTESENYFSKGGKKFTMNVSLHFSNGTYTLEKTKINPLFPDDTIQENFTKEFYK
jgi:hypothetical protein